MLHRMTKSNTSTHSHAPTPRQSRNIPRRFGVKKTELLLSLNLSTHCPWLFCDRQLFTNKTKNQKEGGSVRATSWHQHRVAPRRAHRNVRGELGWGTSERRTAACSSHHKPNKVRMNHRWEIWVLTYEPVNLIGAADITTGQDARAATRHICLFAENTWTQSIQQFDTHKHTRALSVSLSHTLTRQDSLPTLHQQDQLNSSVIRPIKIRIMGLDMVRFCIMIQIPINSKSNQIQGLKLKNN